MYAGGKKIDPMKAVRAGRINVIWIHRVNPARAKIEKEILTDIGSWKSERRLAGASLWRIIKSAACDRAA